ncbi:MAG: hypothetical protein JWP97_3505 [Labilithrix sp.]|nr:hypothetical protein [Labilithrix sp.]
MTAARSKSELEAWLDGFVRNPEFLEAYPYYAAILAKLVPVADPSVSRMAVSLHGGQFYLHVNVDAFLREPQYLRGILLHEVHHVVLGHLTHPKFTEVEEPELMDLAVEMSANEYIAEPLPPAVTWRAYSSIGVRAGQSTRERYEILVRHLQGTGSRPKAGAGEQGTGIVDDHRFLGKGAALPGGVAQAALLVSRAVEQSRQERRERENDPSHPADDEEDDENAPRVPRRYLVAGRTAGSLVEELFETVRPPEHYLDWPAALSMFVARARTPVHTWSRPSRRFPTRIFEVPGRSWAPRRTENPRVLVAIDTSLSMTKYELEEIARQLNVLGEHAVIIVAECDVSVARVYPFDGRIENVVGRGGTDLRPVFAPGLLGTHDVDGVIYFTDGDGPFDPEPPQVPVLWVLTKPQAFRCPWGERARLRPERL